MADTPRPDPREDDPSREGIFRSHNEEAAVGAVADNTPTLVAEFTKCLGTMSHSRAGWDYQLSKEQRAKEDREERVALARVRAIWAENPDLHEELRAAFVAASPLATMREIEGAV